MIDMTPESLRAVELAHEPDEIPIEQAVQEMHAIRDQLDAALEQCECKAQGAPTMCGACE